MTLKQKKANSYPLRLFTNYGELGFLAIALYCTNSSLQTATALS